ncbi:membrane-anchored protein [Rhizobium cauense]|uniref:membrane-anchored protein n=1 Tax=Rhizobium cauense TaxID=1166683 RepID=UPI001C6DF52D|nr:membrane-anchored protein [Rhizobium cauense]MBW9114809.1 membrane-anchored protein [Rhizobium cauense]
MSYLSDLIHLKRHANRWLRYRLAAPQVPNLEELFKGKNVVVVGSAPVSTEPPGWNDRFRVLTINASQVAATAWLKQAPDATLMQFNQIEGTNPAALEVRKVLKHQKTGMLCILNWRHDLPRLQRGIEAFQYSYDELKLISRHERIALMHRMTGRLNLEMEGEAKWSNGIVGVALAINSGAANVILTGIDPLSNGHKYNSLDLSRMHKETDLEALKAFREREMPIFTADPHVAQSTNLPLWALRS